jgi:hypothetical protein
MRAVALAIGRIIFSHHGGVWARKKFAPCRIAPAQ